MLCIRPDCFKTSRSVALLILLHPDQISVLTSTPPYQAISEVAVPTTLVAVPTTLAPPLLCLLVLAVVDVLWERGMHRSYFDVYRLLFVRFALRPWLFVYTCIQYMYRYTYTHSHRQTDTHTLV